MDTIVEKVDEHLKEVTTSPSIQLSTSILSELDRNLCSNLSTDSAISLISRIVALLPLLQQISTALTDLLERIAEHSSITFNQICQIQPAIPLLEGLTTKIPELNLVTLALLQTARSSSEIAVIAGRPELVEALIELWLASEDIGVSSKAWRVTALLLGAEVDSSSVSNMRCTGEAEEINIVTNLMWRRLLTDKNVYGLLFSLTSLKTLGLLGQSNRRAKGISQFRLMDLIITFSQVSDLWRSQVSEIEQAYDVDSQEGLINYTVIHMVDTGDDVLEKLQLLQYYTEFVKGSLSRGNLLRNSSRNLEYLVTKGIHEEIIHQFISTNRSDPMEELLQPSIIAYVQGYISHHPNHFLQDSTRTRFKILHHVFQVLNSTLPNQWSQNNEPTGLLGLLSTLPPECILPSFIQSISTTPILFLPIHPPNKHIFLTLAKIFHGPLVSSPLSTSSSPSATTSAEAAAKILFKIYTARNPTFFVTLISAASLHSIPQTALAALILLEAIITSNWSVPPPSNPSPVPSSISSTSTQSDPPQSGISTILLPPAISHVIPFFLSSTQHLAGGQTGGAYDVAVKRFEVLGALAGGVRKLLAEDVDVDVDVDGGEDDGKGLRDVLAALEERIRNGVLGRGVGVGVSSADGFGEEVTHSVATLSR